MDDLAIHLHLIIIHINLSFNNFDSFYRIIETSELEELKKIARILHPEIPSVENLNYSQVDRYWFWRLDYELWDHRNDENGWLKNHPELNAVVNR